MQSAFTVEEMYDSGGSFQMGTVSPVADSGDGSAVSQAGPTFTYGDPVGTITSVNGSSMVKADISGKKTCHSHCLN